MKLYNRELEQIENEERRKRIQALAEREILFLVENYRIDEVSLRKKLEKLAIVEREGKSYFVEYNGKKQEITRGDFSSIASFVTHKNQIYDGNKWSFEIAVYTNDNNDNHTIKHELFHFFSKNQEMNFNENNLGYDKTGTCIIGYDREDRIVDESMQAEGLNEGITEFLANQIDEISTPGVYCPQVYLASILINSQDNSLINAYFSDDSKKFKEFLNDFDKRQSVVSSDKLVSLARKGQEVDIQLLKGCLEYSLSFCHNIEQLKFERQRLLPIFKSMYSNLNLEYSDEKFDIVSFFKDTFSEKRKNIESKSTQELGNETLSIQSETTYIDETERKINQEEKNCKIKTKMYKNER